LSQVKATLRGRLRFWCLTADLHICVPTIGMSATFHFGGDIRQVTRCAEWVGDLLEQLDGEEAAHGASMPGGLARDQRVADAEDDADRWARKPRGAHSIVKGAADSEFVGGELFNQ
jgi:hypothetical protein